MSNRRTREFRDLYSALPLNVRRQAITAYRLFIVDPRHPSLRNKELISTARGQHRPGSRSVAITMKYRAIYLPTSQVNVWYWIGTHNDYESFIGRK